MEKITKIQFWQIEAQIKYNKHLSIVKGSLYMSSYQDITIYKDDHNKKWLYSDKNGYFADSALLKLIKQFKN